LLLAAVGAAPLAGEAQSVFHFSQNSRPIAFNVLRRFGRDPTRVRIGTELGECG
jgi:hypothetical protein